MKRLLHRVSEELVRPLIREEINRQRLIAMRTSAAMEAK